MDRTKCKLFENGVDEEGNFCRSDCDCGEVKLPDLIVTKNGVPFEDQQEGIRQFKAAALRRHSPEDQSSITQWGLDTFGPTHPAAVAKRMSKEVAELLALFEQVGHEWDGKKQVRIPVEKLDPELLQKMHLECADVGIMLLQIAELLQVDINVIIDFKMGINRGRRWAYDPAKEETRHVSDFHDYMSGIRVKIDKYYVMTDSGSLVTSEGFDSAEEAFKFAQTTFACQEYGYKRNDVGIPKWNPEICNWDNDDHFISVLFGRDLYDYQQNEEKLATQVNLHDDND